MELYLIFQEMTNDTNDEELRPLNPEDLGEGEWVQVFYEGEKFLGKVVDTTEIGQVKVRCLEKPFGVSGPQQLEREEDTIPYEYVYPAPVAPRLVKKGRKWMWEY